MSDKDKILAEIQQNAEANGYFLCPDKELLDDLIEGLDMNKDRYGYGSCPCRIGCGLKRYDADIICPCEYRDADVNEFGMCYCGLFVSESIKNDPSKLTPIPERRPIEAQDAAMEAKERLERGEELPEASYDPGTQPSAATTEALSTNEPASIPVWRCKICGYLCARELPPPICPICKAKSDKFERFSFG